MKTYSGVDIVPVRRVAIPGSYVSPPLRDVAVSLHRICRYCGHGKQWWSVLQHSLAVAHLLRSSPNIADVFRTPQLILDGLLHDAHESIVSDVPRGWKTDSARLHERDLDRRIRQDLSIGPITDLNAELVKFADDEILCAESASKGPIGWVEAATMDAHASVAWVTELTVGDDPRKADGTAIDMWLLSVQQHLNLVINGEGLPE